MWKVFVLFILAFRCAYCYFLNPARKTRPQAPHLPEFGETKMSLGPSATATETDHDVTASLPGICLIFLIKQY